MGVAGVIVPWNSPIILAARSFAPTLAAGCTVVIKMPGQAAQIAGVLAEILAKASDLPNGVMNIFVESGSDGVALLVESPDVPTISFTGSTKTGVAGSPRRRSRPRLKARPQGKAFPSRSSPESMPRRQMLLALLALAVAIT
jgi:acyl-CoA reductase-like NAD-dependent aldehyde dehydrogenase